MAKQINSSGEVIKEMCFARNDMRILAIVRDCGFVTAKQVHDIMVYRGFKETHMKHVYGYLKRLANMGHVEFHRRVLPNNTGVLSVTNSGHAMLQMWGYGLGINADPHSSPAGVDHFLALNEAMLKFHRNYKVSFWLTDFGVQAENEVRREDGFAKDYDAVTEITFDNSPLTLALEYEHTLRNRTRYLTVFLQRASYRDRLVPERSLVDAAIRKGLYRELGRKYQQRLDTILEAARSEIAGGKIRTPDELRAHLQEEARRIPGTNDPQRTEMHLLIDARQNGLYHLLGQNQLPKALSLELSADRLAA